MNIRSIVAHVTIGATAGAAHGYQRALDLETSCTFFNILAKSTAEEAHYKCVESSNNRILFTLLEGSIGAVAGLVTAVAQPYLPSTIRSPIDRAISAYDKITNFVLPEIITEQHFEVGEIFP